MRVMAGTGPETGPGGHWKVLLIVLVCTLWNHTGQCTDSAAAGSASTPSSGDAATSTPSPGHAATSTPSTGDAATSTPSTGDAATSTPSTGDAATSTPSTGDAATSTPSTGDAATSTPSTVDTSAVMPSTVDTSALMPSTVDTSALMPSTVDTSALMPSTVDTSALMPSTVDTSALMPSTVDTSALMPSTVDTSALMPSTVDTSALMPSTVDTSALMPSTVDTSALMPSTVDTSALMPSTVDTSTSSATALVPSDTSSSARLQASSDAPTPTTKLSPPPTSSARGEVTPTSTYSGTQPNTSTVALTSTVRSTTTTIPSEYRKPISEMTVPVPLTIKFSNQSFSEELYDRESELYRNRSSEYQLQLENVLKDTEGFVSVDIRGFWPGSLGVDFTVVYNYTYVRENLTEEHLKTQLGHLAGVNKTFLNETLAQGLDAAKQLLKEDPCRLVCPLWNCHKNQGGSVQCINPCYNHKCQGVHDCIVDSKKQPKCLCKSDDKYMYGGELCQEKTEKLKLSSTTIIAIACGIGGGLIFILFIALLVTCCRKRKHRGGKMRGFDDQKSEYENPGEAMAFRNEAFDSFPEETSLSDPGVSKAAFQRRSHGSAKENVYSELGDGPSQTFMYQPSDVTPRTNFTSLTHINPVAATDPNDLSGFSRRDDVRRQDDVKRFSDDRSRSGSMAAYSDRWMQDSLRHDEHPGAPVKVFPDREVKAYPTKEPDYPGREPMYPGSRDPGYQTREPPYPAQSAHSGREYDSPTREPPYPAKYVYPGRRTDYPAREPPYPAREPAYPAREPAYPAREPAYPAREPASLSMDPSYRGSEKEGVTYSKFGKAVLPGEAHEAHNPLIHDFSDKGQGRLQQEGSEKRGPADRARVFDYVPGTGKLSIVRPGFSSKPMY